jgi:hypothetical protein
MATTGSSSGATSAAAAPASGEASDVVVGLPALDHGSRAERAIEAVRASLGHRAPSVRCRIVVSRPASGDAAREDSAGGSEEARPWNDVTATSYARHPSDALTVPFHGMTARARALHAILKDAQTRQARACVLVDPRAPLTADWIDGLLRPLLDDAVDVVAPIYHRHPFSGAIVHGIVYPLFRALYGAGVRYPIGTDVACSRAAIDAVIDDPIWESDAGQLGIDLWLSAAAVSRGLRIGQAYLGDRPEERTGLDLGSALTQVLGVCFSDMERQAATWHRVRGSRPLPSFGQVPPPARPPQVDAAELADSFRLGSRELQDVWADVLPPLAILQWRRLAQASGDAFRVDDGLWARTIYDFAMGYRLRVIAREHLLGSMAPLYLGWLASFVAELQHRPPAEAEARIERLCLVFEAEKPYLISQWRWPERFKPVKVRR